MVILIVGGALGKKTERIENQRKNQDYPLLRSVRILKRVLETCCHSDSSERPTANNKFGLHNSNRQCLCRVQYTFNT